MALTYVFAEHVPTKISVKIAPCGMDVVGAVLRVGVFKQEARALDAIIVRLKLFHASRPGKTNIIQAAFFNLGPVFLGPPSTRSGRNLYTEPPRRLQLGFHRRSHRLPIMVILPIDD